MFVAGDLNIHHKKLLKYSNANTETGTQLKAVFDHFGMWQAVHEPTRNEYLLDLVRTDIQNAKTTITPAISDHKGVMTKLPFAEVLEASVEREVWNLSRARWDELKKALSCFNWGRLRDGTAEDALLFFMEILWHHLVKFIPRRRITTKKRSHPWLDGKCIGATHRQNLAEGGDTHTYKVESDRCAKIFIDAKTKYVNDLKEELAGPPKCSKKLWTVKRELLNRKGKCHQCRL